MSMQYVRDTYGVPVKRGQLVRGISGGKWEGVILRVRSCSHYVHAGFDGHDRTLRIHPTDLEYKTADGWWSKEDEG